MTPDMAAWPPDPPLVAILRGLSPERALATGETLLKAGFRAIEVPLNRPGALDSIARLAALQGRGALVGAGTVLQAAQVDNVAAAGGRLIVSPHTDVAVVRRARELGMRVVPGIFTASEAFAALHAGADALKIFPAEAMPLAGLRALLTVLPAGTHLWPVGGIAVDAMGAWLAAGATGFGIGSSLYRPDFDDSDIAQRAAAFIDGWASGKRTRAAPA